MSKMNEQIIVASRTSVFNDEELAFQGVNSNQSTVKQITENIANSFSVMRRGNAEEDKDYKQPIPYAVLKRGDEVFIYERLTGGGEDRLHNQLSLGVGGHANDTGEDNFDELIINNLNRELEEELIINHDQELDMSLEYAGLINDDENDVGLHHIGILSIIELPLNTDVQVRETEQLKGGWISIQNLKKQDTYQDLESWSQFVADILNQ